MNVWVGIDISKDFFDAAWVVDGHRYHVQLANRDEGFKALLEQAPAEARFLMEATGTYYINLALTLHEANRYVGVVNPVRVRNYNKADMARSKSDKSDAYSIARFGTEKQPAPWRPLTPDMAKMQQLRAVADKIGLQISMLRNQKHAFTQSRLACKEALDIIDCSIRFQSKLLDVALLELDTLARTAFPRQMDLVTSIPGIGQETAARLMALVGDFTRFETSRRLVSYIGLSPTLKQSGSSVRSRGHISRMGNKHVRRAVFQCALSAIRFNPHCKIMWERMKEQKKPSKLVLIAIANKLVRTAHALIRSNKPFDPNFANFSLA